MHHIPVVLISFRVPIRQDCALCKEFEHTIVNAVLSPPCLTCTPALISEAVSQHTSDSEIQNLDRTTDQI